ncbi:MAG: carboxypeptidase-like regulatory domain-containing protein, partial [Solirubrobacteraceae bacterium]
MLTLVATLSLIVWVLTEGAAGALGPALLSGRVVGFKAPTLGAIAVQAVSANDGTVAGVATARVGAYRLAVPPGPYLVHVQDEDFRRRTTEGVSDVTSLGSGGGRLSVNPGSPPAARAAATGASPIIAIEPMQITAADGSGLKSGSMQGQVISAIFDPCT